MNKKIVNYSIIALIVCLILSSCDKLPTEPSGGGGQTYVLTSANSFFTDVPANHWAHDYIKILFDNKYIFGRSTEPLTYEPDNTLTRAEIAVFVVRGVHGTNYTPPQPNAQLLADVPLSHWAVEWVTQLYNDGYTSGTGDVDKLGRPYYKPEEKITRAEACVYFLRMLKGADYKPEVTGEKIFADVEVDQWYAKWIEAAFFEKLACPYRTDPRYEFKPLEPITRAMTAYMMAKAKKFEPGQNIERDVSKAPIGKDILVTGGIQWKPAKNVNLASQIDKNAPRSQYKVLNPEKNEYGAEGEYGYNLCGQICLSMILETITGEKYKLIEIYNAAGAGTGTTTVEHLKIAITKLFPIQTKTADWIFDKKNSSKLRTAMNSGHYLVTLNRFLKYDNNNWCMLSTKDFYNDIYHWIVVTGFTANWNAFDDGAGLNWIKINNPFNNRLEFYPFRDFMESLDELRVLEIY